MRIASAGWPLVAALSLLCACSSGKDKSKDKGEAEALRKAADDPDAEPDPALPSSSHWVVRYAREQKPAEGVEVTQHGAAGSRQATVDARGRVPRSADVRHVELRHPGGLVLFRGDLPESGVLEVERPLTVEATLEGFGEDVQVWIGSGEEIPLHSYHKRDLGIPRPSSPDRSGLTIAARWAEVEIDAGAITTGPVLPSEALQIVARDASGASVALDLDPAQANDGALTLAEPLRPAPSGTIEIQVDPTVKLEGRMLVAQIAPGPALSQAARRHAVLLHAADPELATWLAGRRAVPIDASKTTVIGVPSGTWKLSLVDHDARTRVSTELGVSADAPAVWSLDADELAKGAAEPLAMQGYAQVRQLPAPCTQAALWTTDQQYTGVPGGLGTDFVPIMGLFYETQTSEWPVLRSRVREKVWNWKPPNLLTLRCKSSDCATSALVPIQDIPEDGTGWVAGLVQYSPFLIGISPPKLIGFPGDAYTLGAKVNSGMDGAVMSTVKVIILQSNGQSVPQNVSVSFGAQLHDPSPTWGKTDSEGVVIAQNKNSDWGYLTCVNTPDSPLNGGMPIFVEYNGEYFDDACQGYTDTSGTRGCIVVRLEQGGGVCHPMGAECSL